ncbi:glycosyl-4,4'-diaponeurosporenoate acyltransferase [Paenibacillus soyae]|uniref:Glycosyl-4,4'-diaponeurosporenoate acyltransferase n=1 Tax=Paenibacillus soyae TaxID=2969249 RepID=A0A9X2SAZ8_9BACL|nr:glycosyl-4,4'-diaponeurosporenoate acyltransferase [Paenibacillus soyae]MCR2806796.1 glycosyl-4,4'-diaponeurosporenoate acyltransferase [Paenibacillus soyae]
MRIIELSHTITLLLDIAAWFVIHLAVSVLALRLPARLFAEDSFLYRIRGWEDSGRLWQRLLRVKSWKHRIPDGTLILKKGYNKSRLSGTGKSDLLLFVRESRRAELTHWLSMAPAPLFFLWNPAWAGWLMVLYAVLFNAPIIVAQRFNRPRFRLLAERMAGGGPSRQAGAAGDT